MTQIIVEGTIAPWLWNGNSFYQGQLTDIGLFGPVGASLTGDSIQIVWNSNPVTAAITINGTTITLQATGWFATYASVGADYQNVTVANFNPTNNYPGNVAVDSFSPSGSYRPPLGLGGSLELIGPAASCNAGTGLEFGGGVPSNCNQVLDGYFYVTSMTDSPIVVPGPTVGENIFALITLPLLITYWWWNKRMSKR